MARLYSNENFPLEAVRRLRSMGHDVLTSFEAGQAKRIDGALRSLQQDLSNAVIRVNRPAK